MDDDEKVAVNTTNVESQKKESLAAKAISKFDGPDAETVCAYTRVHETCVLTPMMTFAYAKTCAQTCRCAYRRAYGHCTDTS